MPLAKEEKRILVEEEPHEAAALLAEEEECGVLEAAHEDPSLLNEWPNWDPRMRIPNFAHRGSLHITMERAPYAFCGLPI